MMSKKVLAFDFGASSGRAMLAEFDGKDITMNEIHRFSNDPVKLQGTFYWDILRLMHEIKQGIVKAVNAGGFDAIGIDTWGACFFQNRTINSITNLSCSDSFAKDSLS